MTREVGFGTGRGTTARSVVQSRTGSTQARVNERRFRLRGVMAAGGI
jgi:hypothetical protein